MVEIGIFRKELHEMEMKNTGFSLEDIRKYTWVDVADGHEVVATRYTSNSKYQRRVS